MMTETDRRMLMIAYEEAKRGFDEGGCPIGSVLARGGEEVSRGHNQRVQQGDPIAHGEMDALRKAGRQRSYRDTVLYTTLSPCMTCSGTIVQFGIPRGGARTPHSAAMKISFAAWRRGGDRRRSGSHRADGKIHPRKAGIMGRGHRRGVRCRRGWRRAVPARSFTFAGCCQIVGPVDAGDPFIRGRNALWHMSI